MTFLGKIQVRGLCQETECNRMIPPTYPRRSSCRPPPFSATYSVFVRSYRFLIPCAPLVDTVLAVYSNSVSAGCFFYQVPKLHPAPSPLRLRPWLQTVSNNNFFSFCPIISIFDSLCSPRRRGPSRLFERHLSRVFLLLSESGTEALP